MKKISIFSVITIFILFSSIFISNTYQDSESQNDLKNLKTKIVDDELSDDLLDPDDISDYELEISKKKAQDERNLKQKKDEIDTEEKEKEKATTTTTIETTTLIKEETTESTRKTSTKSNNEETTEQTESKKTTTTTTTTTEISTTESSTNVSLSTSTATEEDKTIETSTENSSESTEETKTTTESIETTDTTTTNTDEFLTPNPSKSKSEKPIIIIDHEVTSTKYRTITIDKATDKSDVVYYRFKAINPIHQIELNIITESHLDFSLCALSFNNSVHECVSSYVEILNSRFVLKVSKNLLPYEIKLKYRLIISGCDSFSSIRDLDLETNMPVIYHNSDQDCVYRIKNTDVSRLMMSVLIQAFPVHDDKICHASMYVSNANSLEKNDTHMQAMFESFESIEPFQQGVFVSTKYVLIKLINCFENNEPIEVKINPIRRSSKEIKMTEKENKYYHRLDSAPITSLKLDSTLLFEVINEDHRNIINFKLSEYRSKTTKESCETDSSQNSSIITVYGEDQFNQMYLKQFTPCKFDSSVNELRGFKKVYIQFYREPYHPTKSSSPDNFVMEFNLKLVKKFYKVLNIDKGYFSTEKEQGLMGSDLRNEHFDFEIQAPFGSRIVLNLTKFTNGKQFNKKSCTDYVIVKLNRTTNKIDSLIEKNPKFCNSMRQYHVYSTFSNKLLLTFIFGEINENEEDSTQPAFEFSYHFEQICNNIFKRLNKSIISFSSLETKVSNVKDENLDCLNTIQVKNARRIILYKINWLKNKNAMLNQEEEININYINGPSVCKSSDSLMISNENPKYVKNTKNQYCLENPFYSFISESNNLYLNFKRFDDPIKKIKPLVFDIGYFSYKYLYSDNDNLINVDFSSIIPKNVGNLTKIDSLQFKIKLSDSNNYIYPVISDCFTEISTGMVNIRANQRSIPFQMSCKNQTYTFMSSMENELIIEFANVNLKELKDNEIRFKLNYTTLPRVFTSLNGQFETNNFEHNYINPVRESVEYEFLINLEPSYMIKFSIDELKNDLGVHEFTIFDENTNKNLYEQNELIENYKLNKKFNYLFSSNRIRISFKHMKENNAKLAKYPYLKCSYKAEPKILNTNQMNGEIVLNNTLTKNVLDWTIIAPVDHVVIIKLAKYSATEDRGQLKFSSLSTGYGENGIYHFNLNNKLTSASSQNLYDRETDIIVSKDNLIHFEYSSGGLNDFFKIDYSFVRKLLTLPCGMIKPYYNNLTQPIIHVPKLTDQNWIIRAPYSKRIQLFTKSIDLLSENPCSKASVNFYEANGTLIESKCNQLSYNTPNLDIVTGSNELNIKFITQNTNEVVYLNTPPQFHLYQGFIYYYAFLERPGECYFQSRKNYKCDYKNIGDVKWLLKDDTIKAKGQDEVDFDKHFCTTCYMNAHIPLQSEEGTPSSAVLVSPVISKAKKYLKFWYKLKNSAKLSVKFIYEKEFMNNSTDRAVVLKVINQTTTEWKMSRVKVGSQLFYDFRILFVLESGSFSSALQPEASLDNIELFDIDLDCSVTVDPVCPIDEDTHRIQSGKTKNILTNDLKSKTTFCQKYITPCDFNKCQNDGVCLNSDEFFNPLISVKQASDDNYECLCGYGFTGRFCETRLNPCDIPGLNKCSLESKCVPSEQVLMEYECKCDKFHFGQYCEHKYEPCKLLENPCNQLNGQGICNNLGTAENPKNHSCTCSPMYSGPNCEFVIKDRCLTSECTKHDPKAVCIELEDKFVCKCSVGFEGPTCTNIDDCVSSPCQNNGTCVDGINSFKCKCDERFQGKYCEESKICSKCDPEGTLYCNQNELKCVCKETHDGDFCEIELDPCQTQPCVHGDCVSNKLDGDYECICHYGYKGRVCDKKEDLCDQGFCQNGGTCILELEHETDNVGYLCKCPMGFDGKNCEILVDFCDSTQCKNGGTCISSASNYTCVCPVGYTGKNCDTRIDNCFNSKCSHGSTCVNVLNSYICKCPPGYYGRYCDEEADKCLKNECQNGKCIPNDLDNQYRCNCMPGYTGKYCEINIDDCDSNPCQNNAVCVDLLNTYKCVCPQNYTGRNCENTFNYCSLPETSCHTTNTKRCIPIPGGNICECLPRFTGIKCETQIDFCDFYKPCRSGKCKNLGLNDYICENCELGWVGKNCSEMSDYCNPKNPCQNGGICIFKAKGYFCKCPDGYTGKTCDEKINLQCMYNKCKHNSTCVPTQNGYRCECDNTYEGLYCELKKKDLCKDIPCDGYCVDGKCECDPRIIFCKKDSQCHNIKCQNGGTCIDVIKGETTIGMCLCPPGLMGKYCDQSMFCNSTKALPCGSTSQCATVNQTYECTCDRPYIGHGCSKKLSEYLPDYEQFLKQEKLMNEKSNCKFGNSKESKLLIGIIALGFVVLLIVGFLIGHFSVISYRKRYESRMDKTRSNFSMASDNDSMNFVPKTPLMKSRAAQEITLNKSAGGFSIPRPSVRL